MKLIKLSLSDSAYCTALALAAAHGIPLESYISGEVEDLLDKKPQSPNKQRVDGGARGKPGGPPPSSGSIMRDTLRQVLDVSAYVYRTGNVPKDEVHARVEFRHAVRTVA